MNPIYELKREHDSILIVLSAMKRLATEILKNKQVDLFRIAQIIEFLKTYIDHCHHDKEEEILFPSLSESNPPWLTDTLHLLMDEHIIARGYIKSIEANLHEYLAGHAYAIESLATSMLHFITLEETHIKTENQAILPLAEKYFNRLKLESISLDFNKIQKRDIVHFQNLEYYILLRKLYFESNNVKEKEFAY